MSRKHSDPRGGQSTTGTAGKSKTRRDVLKLGAVASALAVTGSTVGIAQEASLDLSIDVAREDEYITITNNGDSEADLTGFVINFEAEDEDYNQERALAGEVLVEAGGSVVVPTGAREVPEADVELEDPYDGEVLNNDGSDVVALYDGAGNEVATSDGSGGDGDGDGSDDGSDEPEETHTLSVTVVDGEDLGILGGAEVTVDGETKTTESGPDQGSKHFEATFEVSDGDYEVTARHEVGEFAKTGSEEVTIDGEDNGVSVEVYPEDDEGDSDSGSESGSDTDTGTESDSESESDDCPKN